MTGLRAAVVRSLLVGLLIAFPPIGAPPATPTPPGNVHLALGDSLTAGVGASDPGARGFAALVTGYLSAQTGRPTALVNLAVPGETTASFLSGGQLARAEAAIADAHAVGRRLDPITLSLGANDLIAAPATAADRERALAGVAANLRRILAALVSAAGPGDRAPRLLVLTPYDPTATDPSLPNTDAWWIARLNDAIAAETAGAGGTLVPLDPVVRGREAELTHRPTDIHPTNAGHAAIAAAVWAASRFDRNPPSVRFDRPAPGTLTRRTPTVAALVGDPAGIAEVTWSVDGALQGPLPFVPALGAHATVWDTRPLAPGRHLLEVRATDIGGNVATASLMVEVLGPATPLPSN